MITIIIIIINFSTAYQFAPNMSDLTKTRVEPS